jgi:hypothetical protein
VWGRPGARARVILVTCFHPKYTTSQQPTVRTTTGSNVIATATHSHSIHTSTHMKHGERVCGFSCVCGGVEGSERGDLEGVDVVKTRPRVKQGPGGVGKRCHTSPSSKQWQVGNICRTSGAGRGVGIVLEACRRPYVHVRVKHKW